MTELTAQTTMQQVLDAVPGAQAALFARYHIGGCAACGYEPGETVEQVCRRKGLDVEAVLETIRTAPPAEHPSGGRQIPLTTAAPATTGPLPDAHAVGTVGNAECGEFMTMWVRFREDQGRRVIDRASFESYGCETAIALASRATELIRGKTAEEALQFSGDDFAGEAGPLPPVKIHCAELVQGALRSALETR